jgi:hypothetical protein
MFIFKYDIIIDNVRQHFKEYAYEKKSIIYSFSCWSFFCS